MDMIETVAKAIYVAGHWERISMQTLGGDIFTDQRAWDGAANYSRGECRRLARAAVEAMRDVTKEMAEAGDCEADNQEDSGFSSNIDGDRYSYSYLRSGAATAIYIAMVNAALTSQANEVSGSHPSSEEK